MPSALAAAMSTLKLGDQLSALADRLLQRRTRLADRRFEYSASRPRRPIPRPSGGIIFLVRRGQGRQHPDNVDIEVFRPERELIPIRPLRSPSELRTMQALNN
jgi:hypothetical protein